MGVQWAPTHPTGAVRTGAPAAAGGGFGAVIRQLGRVVQSMIGSSSLWAVFGYCRCKENFLCMMYETKSVCKIFSQIDAILRVESNESN